MQLVSQIVKPIHGLKIEAVELIGIGIISLQGQFVNLGMELISPHLLVDLFVSSFCPNAEPQ